MLISSGVIDWPKEAYWIRDLVRLQDNPQKLAEKQFAATTQLLQLLHDLGMEDR